MKKKPRRGVERVGVTALVAGQGSLVLQIERVRLLLFCFKASYLFQAAQSRLGNLYSRERRKLTRSIVKSIIQGPASTHPFVPSFLLSNLTLGKLPVLIQMSIQCKTHLESAR
jgi:hypothetical protein